MTLTAKRKKVLNRIFKSISYFLLVALFLGFTFVLLYFRYDRDLSQLFNPNSNNDIYTMIVSIISAISVSSLLWLAIARIVKIFKRKKV